jgi:hypothetical protein
MSSIRLRWKIPSPVPSDSEYIKDGYAREACSLENENTSLRMSGGAGQASLRIPVVHCSHLDQGHDRSVHGHDSGKQDRHKRGSNLALDSRN